jgi:nucleotide-binding universal stress UspA family protein
MKVIVGVDGSKYGNWALEAVLALPFARLPEMTALHVVDLAALRSPLVFRPPMIGYEGFINVEAKRLEREARHIAQVSRKKLAAAQTRARAVIKKGSVAATILKEAGRRALIVLGQRGLGKIDRFFLGSVSAQVTHHALAPVLIVKSRPASFTKILLAVDGSKASEDAARFLIKHIDPIKTRRIEVIVLLILPPFAYTRATKAAMALTHRYAQKLEATGYIVKESIQAGDPAEEIIKASKSSQADLLVVGAKGLGGVTRFLLGSVSSKLLRHSPCSILIIR